MSEYIGRRIIPVHGGVWNGSKSYEGLTIVLHQDSGDSYISRRTVPAGTAITDEAYWMLHSQYSQQIADAVAQVEAVEDRLENVETRLDANVSASTDEDADYAAEVVDARVDNEDNTYDSLGAHIREIGKGTGIVNQGVTRNKVQDIAFSQLNFDGLDMLAFDDLVITSGMQFAGYDTTTFTPIYHDSSEPSVQQGVVYDFPISNLTDLGVTTLYLPTGAPLAQKGILYTEGESANNVWIPNRTVEDGCYVIPIGTYVKGFERMALSFLRGNERLDCTRDMSDQAESRILSWVKTKDLADGAVTKDKVDSSVAQRLMHYPFDYTKETSWQTEYGKRSKEGMFLYVQLYECDPAYDYGISAVWRNHTTQYTRSLRIATFDKETHELVETIASYSADNEDGEAPDYVELIRLKKNGRVIADIIVDWPLEAYNDWRSAEIFHSSVTSPNEKYDPDITDEKYILTQSGFNALLQDSFPFNGNLVSTANGEHRVSRGYDVDTKLPIWVESDYYREFTLDVPQYGYFYISRRNTEDTQTIQIYAFREDGTVWVNTSDKTEMEEKWYGLTVMEDELVLNCEKAYSAGIRQYSFTFDIRQTPDFYIKAVGNYIPSWLGVEEMKHDFLVDSNVEFVLPSALRVAGGVEMNIYYQNIIRYLNAEKCQLVKTNTTFSNYASFARWIPDEESETSMSLKFLFYLNNTYEQDITGGPMTVAAVPKSVGSGETKKVLCIGDSLTDADAFTGELVNLFADDEMGLQLLGTLGSGENLNEGRSGWRAYTYVNCSEGSEDLSNLGYTNPFYNPDTETFDFSYYMEQQGFEGVDYVFICLGTNDIARGNYKSDEELQTYWDAMIESIHEYDENIRIGLWLPPTRSLMANRNRQAIDSSLAMNKWLISTYDGREDENIYLVPVYLNVDPYHDYRASEVAVSSRNSDFTMVVDSDAVHPATAGYKKIADVIYSYIKYFASLDENEVEK